MTIHSLQYLLFVALVWFCALPVRSPKLRQALFLIVSYSFYATWGLGFLAVLIASSILNFAWGLVLRRRPTLGLLWGGIALNVALLGVFKYLPHLADAVAGSPLPDVFRRIVMPVGISFWTFQGLSYLFDVYREEESEPSLLEFCLYMAFWPTVLSGPVCRLYDMLPQFRSVPHATLDDVTVGTRRILIGFFMKLVLAQVLAAGVTSGGGVSDGFDQVAGGWGGIDVWMLAMGFGFQLFFDFAGYSHIVIGTARLFGIRLQENFDRPYLSATPSIFWTRWHMSLSFWIRDYVFLSVATLRREPWWRSLALVFAMTLFGLWHGAAGTFLAWGVYHGLLLVGHRQGPWLLGWVPLRVPPGVGAALSCGMTFALVSLGWIFFRANDLGQALRMLEAVVLPSRYFHFSLNPRFYLVTAAIVAGYFLYARLDSLWARAPAFARVS